MTTKTRLSKLNFWLALVIIATLPHFLGRYFFAISDQLEQLPLILRQIDPNLFGRDYFVLKNSEEFGPRFFYSHFFAFLSSFIELSWAFFLVSLANHFFFVVVLAKTSYHFFKDELAAVLFALLAVFVLGFTFAASGYFIIHWTVPYTMAMPWALLALLYSLQNRIVLAVLIGLISSLFQPLIGLEVTTLGLGVAFVRNVIFKHRAEVVKCSVGGLVFLLGGYFIWLKRLPSTGHSQFLQEVMFHYRLPHHYLPSVFPKREYLTFFIFLIAAVLLIRNLWSKLGEHAVSLTTLLVFLLVLFGGGFIFSEFYPSSLWLSAQVFRLTFLVKWLGFLLFGYAIAQLVREKGWFAAGWLVTGGLAPFVLFAYACCDWVKTRFAFVRNILSHPITAMSVAVIARAVILSKEAWQVLVVLGLFLPLCISTKTKTVYRVLLLFLGIASTVMLSRIVQFPIANKQLWQMSPKITPADTKRRIIDVSRFAEKFLEKDSLFLLPPGQEAFRVIAKRSMFLGLKMMCYEDDCLKEWVARRNALVGPMEETGFRIYRAFNQRYAKLTDDKILSVASQYHIDYAILSADTKTELSVVYEDSWFEIVNVKSNNAPETS